MPSPPCYGPCIVAVQAVLVVLLVVYYGALLAALVMAKAVQGHCRLARWGPEAAGPDSGRPRPPTANRSAIAATLPAATVRCLIRCLIRPDLSRRIRPPVSTVMKVSKVS